MPRVVPYSVATDDSNITLVRRAHGSTFGPAEPTAFPWEQGPTVSIVEAPRPTAPIVRIQKHIRGKLVRVQLQRQMNRTVGVPDIERAKEYSRLLLPHDQDGELLPLSCPIECFRVFGSGIYSYMRWAVLMKRIFFVAFLFSFSSMVDNIFGGELHVKNWLAVPTIGNARSLNAAYGAAELLVLATLLWGMFAAVSIVRKDEALLQPRRTPGERTVLLSGLPAQASTHAQVARAMARYGAVSHAIITSPVREVLMRMPERASLLHALRRARIELFLSRRPAASGGFSAAANLLAPKASQRRVGLESRVESAAQNLRGHDDESCAMLRCLRSSTGSGGANGVPALARSGSRQVATVPLLCLPCKVSERHLGGIALVTFVEPEGAARAIAAIRSSRKDGAPIFEPCTISPSKRAPKLTATRAPEPSDVIWENLHVGPREEWCRQLLSTLLMFTIACIGTGLIAVVGNLNGRGIINDFAQGHLPFHIPANSILGLIVSALLQLLVALPIILGNVIIFISVPILADKYERHATFARKERAIMVKLAFFQIFNTCVAAATFLFQVDDIRQWFTFGGTLIANVCLGDAIFIQILLDFLQIPVIIRRWCIAPCQRSQQAMDEAYTAPAGIYLAFRVQLAVKFTVLAATFGSAIPTLYAYAAFYFWLAAWIDRFNLLRRLAPPPVTDASLTATAAIVIFPVAVLLHVLFALYVFYTFANLAAPSSPHALAPPQLPPLSLPPPVLPPVLPPLNPPNMSGLLLTLTVAPPPAPPHLPPSVPPPFQPPLPPHCHQTYNTAWSAFYLQFITSAVAVGVLTLFLLRELSRYCGCHLRLLSDKQRKVIMQVITQEPDEAHAALVGATATLYAHRSDAYLPPLPPVLLATLGLGPGDLRTTTVERVSDVESAARQDAAGMGLQPLQSAAQEAVRSESRQGVPMGACGETQHITPSCMNASINFRAPASHDLPAFAAPLLIGGEYSHC